MAQVLAPPPLGGAQDSDEALMERMNADSTAACSELFRRYSPRALQTARGICRDSNLAEESVQEAFEGIWKSRSTYRSGRGPVGAWVMSIVRYRAFELAGRNRARLARELGGTVREPMSPDDQPIDAVISHSEAQQLRSVLGRVPPEQREVITLAFYGQMTHTEIARHLCLPAGTVKGRMRLGLAKLRSGMPARP